MAIPFPLRTSEIMCGSLFGSTFNICLSEFAIRKLDYFFGYFAYAGRVSLELQPHYLALVCVKHLLCVRVC